MDSDKLLTRKEFLNRLTASVGLYHAAGKNFSIMIVDIIRFKQINILYGFEVGDLLLETTVKKITNILPKDNFITKISNSAFTLLLNNINHTAQVTLAANKILTLLEPPVFLLNHTIKMHAIIGICHAHPDIKRVDDYIFNAEAALILAKKNNKKSFIYSNEAKADLSVESDIEGKINIAFEEEEFELYYQPKVNLKTGLPVGAEALTRWNNPLLGQINPNNFIPIAEKTGQIIPLTFWGLNTALRQLSEWPNLHPPLSIAINFSAIATQDEDFIEKIESALNIWGVDYTRLIVEITESAFLSDPEKTLNLLKKLKNLGVKLSIDDFGTGYSSLSYFKNIPATELKIDQSFVSKILSSTPDLQITKAIISIAKQFELQIVAEGIEDQATYDALLELGCDIGQGFFIARPMPIKKFVQWLKEYSP